MTEDYCLFVISPGSLWPYPEPSEVCGEPTVEGSEFCDRHVEDD